MYSYLTNQPNVSVSSVPLCKSDRISNNRHTHTVIIMKRCIIVTWDMSQRERRIRWRWWWEHTDKQYSCNKFLTWRNKNQWKRINQSSFSWILRDALYIAWRPVIPDVLLNAILKCSTHWQLGLYIYWAAPMETRTPERKHNIISRNELSPQSVQSLKKICFS